MIWDNLSPNRARWAVLIVVAAILAMIFLVVIWETYDPSFY